MTSPDRNSSQSWAIKAQRLFDGTNSPLIENAVVVIQDGRIAAVGAESEVSVPSGVEVVDVGDRTLLPGIIDAHVHMLVTGGPRSGDESRAMSNEQALLFGTRNALLALKSGLTTVRDCGDREYLSLVLRDSINSGIIAGPRLVCSGPVITSTAGQLWWNSIECDTEDELRRAVRTLVKNGVDFIKVMRSVKPRAIARLRTLNRR